MLATRVSSSFAGAARRSPRCLGRHFLHATAVPARKPQLVKAAATGGGGARRGFVAPPRRTTPPGPPPGSPPPNPAETVGGDGRGKYVVGAATVAVAAYFGNKYLNGDKEEAAEKDAESDGAVEVTAAAAVDNTGGAGDAAVVDVEAVEVVDNGNAAADTSVPDGDSAEEVVVTAEAVSSEAASRDGAVRAETAAAPATDDGRKGPSLAKKITYASVGGLLVVASYFVLSGGNGGSRTDYSGLPVTRH